MTWHSRRDGPENRGGPASARPATWRRVKDRTDREYAQPADVDALARGLNMSSRARIDVSVGERPRGMPALRSPTSPALSWLAGQSGSHLIGGTAGRLQTGVARDGRVTVHGAAILAVRATDLHGAIGQFRTVWPDRAMYPHRMPS